MKFVTRRVVLLALVLSWVSGCSGTTDLEVAEVQVAPITGALTAIGATATTSATVLDASGAEITTTSVAWSTSDGLVASVSSGVVTARGNGSAFVIASAGGLRDSTQIVVDQLPVGVEVVFPYDTILVLDVRARFGALVTDANGTAIPTTHLAVEWASGDTTIATVDSAGFVTPRAAGVATITATAGSSSAEHTVHVAPDGPLSVDVGLAESLQWAIEDALPPTDTFGVSAAIILADGSEWVGTAGWARPGARLRPTAQTAPGSIAKAAAGALLLTVIDDGLLDLDDAVGDVLPSFPNVTPEASLRQLLNNSSGIANYVAHPSYSASIAADTSKLWTHAELMESFVGVPDFTPGLQYTSSNTGFILALMAAASATGDDHRTLMRERVFEPLGLGAGMHMPPWEASPPEAVPGWWVDGNGTLVEMEPFLNTSLLSGRGIGLMTTSRTMAVFFRDFVAGSLLSPGLRAEALTAIPDDGKIPGQNGAGLGLRRYDYLGGEQWGHSGAVSNGSGIVFHDPDLGVTVAVMFNAHPASHQNVHFTLAPELLRIVRDWEP